MPRTRTKPTSTEIASPEQAATEVVKQKRKRNVDTSNWGQEFIEPGDNRKYLSFALESARMPKLNFDDVQSVRERIDWYFTRCMNEDMKPGVVGLASALGVDRKTLWAWKAGTRRDGNKELVDTVKKAYVTLEEMWEYYMQNGKISPPNGIFLGKNNFDYKDVQDVVLTPNTPLQNIDADESRKRLTSAIPDDE